MCHYYVSDEGSPGKSVAVEGKIKSTGDTLEGCRFSQVVSSAITFSFVYQNRHKDRESLIPTIQVSKDGFDVFFYNCKEDILIGQLFGWSRVSLIFLWAILNYRLFPPPKYPVLVQHTNLATGIQEVLERVFSTFRKVNFIMENAYTHHPLSGNLPAILIDACPGNIL